MRCFLAIAILTIAAFLLGRYSKRPERQISLKVDTLYVERIREADTASTSPAVRIIYRDRVEVRTETLRVPVSISRPVISSPEAIQVRRGSVAWTYFRPDLGRWEQAIYPTKPPLTSWQLSAMVFNDLPGWGVGLEGAWRYGRVEGFASIQKTFEHPVSLRLGVRIKLN